MNQIYERRTLIAVGIFAAVAAVFFTGMVIGMNEGMGIGANPKNLDGYPYVDTTPDYGNKDPDAFAEQDEREAGQ